MKTIKGLNKNWKFFYEGLQKVDTHREGKGYDDSSWDVVHLPHDWSIERGYDKERGDGATAFLLGGMGWYRKHFSLTKEDQDKHLVLYFGGIYNNATIFLNGRRIMTHRYGFSPFAVDLTGKGESDNVLAICIDHTRYVDCRWYTGSGVYRSVKGVIYDDFFIDPLRVKLDTTFLSSLTTKVNLRFNLSSLQPLCCVPLRYQIIDEKGVVVFDRTDEERVPSCVCTENMLLSHPLLWDTQHPHLYQLQITSDEKLLYQHHFGVRSFRFDPYKGFFLNEVNMKIKGVCLHHDAGLVGAAVPTDVYKRRLIQLKKLGCNAIRTAHNPQSDEFLTLCDQLGFLVQEEFFDEWDYQKDERRNMEDMHSDYLSRSFATLSFANEAEQDIKDTIRFHYLHPCIIQWSIGNEIEWTYEGNKQATGFFDEGMDPHNNSWDEPYISKQEVRERLEKGQVTEKKIGETAHKLARWVKECDTTRPVTANCIFPSASFESGYADALDVIGFSYKENLYRYARKNYPQKAIMGCENVPQYWEWKAILEKPYIAGTFLWTGIDYLGEAACGTDTWPEKTFNCGLLDFNGTMRPAGCMIKSLWQEEPYLHIVTQTSEKSWYEVNAHKTIVPKDGKRWDRRKWVWPKVNHHWNYQEGEEIIVEVFSNCDSVELLVNETSCGVRYLVDCVDHIYKWAIPFTAGVLQAVGSKEGYPNTVSSLMSAGEATSALLTCDRKALRRGSDECAHIELQLFDCHNHPVLWKEEEMSFTVTGACRILGCDNGRPDNVSHPHHLQCVTNEGKLLLILQADEEVATVRVTACSTHGDLISEPLEITIQ